MTILSYSKPLNLDTAVNSVKRTIAIEQAGIASLADALDDELAEPFTRAIDILSKLKGRVIVTGVGKSGHIGSKIAATLASTGTPAFFVHPAEANHGDLGMIARDDAIIALSWSGETRELNGIVAYSRRFSIPIIAITSGVKSALAKAADVAIFLPKVAEACPHGIAPTTSTLLQLVVGDSIAIALLEMRGFTPDHFRTFHPGGQLGASLTKIRNIMHQGDAIPLSLVGSRVQDAILSMSQRGFGCVVIVDGERRLAGIVTDGDLRRNMADNLPGKTVDQVMTVNPMTVDPDTLAATALQRMEALSITGLIVVEQDVVVGFVHLHDLLRIGAA